MWWMEDNVSELGNFPMGSLYCINTCLFRFFDFCPFLGILTILLTCKYIRIKNKILKLLKFFIVQARNLLDFQIFALFENCRDLQVAKVLVLVTHST
jgi:hypothetical protein